MGLLVCFSYGEEVGMIMTMVYFVIVFVFDFKMVIASAMVCYV